ncbi:MAG: protein-L-isoaspartate(D-aspartate) O-methyltransferase [Promethearchaeota archaeon]
MEKLNEKKKLSNYFLRSRIIKDRLNLKAFENVPREEFMPPNLREMAYSDRPFPLFSTGQTISAPHMCILILEYLNLESGFRVLEIGSGSGYQAALIAERLRLAKNSKKSVISSKVWSIEIVPELASFAKENIKRTGYDEIITIIEGDGTLGLPEEATFDRIILTAAGPQVPPPLIEQLSPGGLLCMPLGCARMWQEMILVSKDKNGELTQKTLASVAFVPLRGKYGV